MGIRETIVEKLAETLIFRTLRDHVGTDRDLIRGLTGNFFAYP
jgi:hypothetical protein